MKWTLRDCQELFCGLQSELNDYRSKLFRTKSVAERHAMIISALLDYLNLEAKIVSYWDDVFSKDVSECIISKKEPK